MRPQFLHLSGPYRGRTFTFEGQKLSIGTDPNAEIRFPGGLNVEQDHAELDFVPDECSFHLQSHDGKVFVNQKEIREVILENDDLLELGVDGPKIRFRTYAEPGKVCKPVRRMLQDANDVRRQGGFWASVQTLRHDLVGHSTRTFRVGFLITLLALIFGAGYVGGWLGSERTARKHEALREKLTEQYQHDLAALRGQIQEFERTQAGHASHEEVEKLRADLADRARFVDQLVNRNVALQKVLGVYTRGVCLIHGVYTFKVQTEEGLVQVVDAADRPIEVEYLGSGFLVDAEGMVVTNRHVAQPWWNNPAVVPLMEQGWNPEFVRLTASFPGREPIVVKAASIRLSEDGVDIATLEVPNVEGVPVLPLHDGEASILRGGRVVVIGYPTGLNALLARAEPDLVSEVLKEATDTATLIEALAKKNAISPVITQGALNDVMERRLIYDAETTSGGSGGPVFGPDGTVIGVNFAITKDFDGSNFGVPIDFAQKMMELTP